MILFLQILVALLAVVLVILVLLQQGKGSDLGSAFGGGSSNSMFGALGPGNALGRLTWILATIFLISTMGLAVVLKQVNSEDSEEFPEELRIDAPEDTDTVPGE